MLNIINYFLISYELSKENLMHSISYLNKSLFDLNVSKKIKNITIILVVLIALYILNLTPYQYLTSLAIDDALYYTIVAKNISSGNGSTFDNITLTNGYHPL